ncbi:hypothetical protein PAL_GLEAN10002600 [Pteropus alecto]|uniref:Uncharacterized protein n=1 Tax=Pteropus alecto TaxID=9402 RepID=L5KY88_PTEAL|nr:hypothetical protein PAL_GLEAN10002600 [Pteropus alecto]
MAPALLRKRGSETDGQTQGRCDLGEVQSPARNRFRSRAHVTEEHGPLVGAVTVDLGLTPHPPPPAQAPGVRNSGFHLEKCYRR